MNRNHKRGILLSFFLVILLGLIAFLRLPKVKAVIMTSLDHTYPTRVKFEAKLEQLGMGPILVDDEVRKGLRNLDYQDLITWNNLRLSLCERSEKFCAGLWYGKLSEEEVYEALSLFEESEMNEWAKIMKSAAKMADKDLRNPSIEEKDFLEGVELICHELSNIDQERFKLATVKGIEASTEIAAFAMKVLLSNEHLEDKVRERFLRYLASQ